MGTMLDKYYDLLTFDKNKPFVRELLLTPKGEWIAVRGLLERVALDFDVGSDEVYGVWLDTVDRECDFVFVAFYDPESGDIKTAIYNRGVLFDPTSRSGRLST